jgi:hypothetical protein
VRCQQRRRRYSIRGLLIVLAALACAGCGGSDATKSRRQAVSAYFAQVTAAQRPLQLDLARLNSAYSRVLTKRMQRGDLAMLELAERDIVGVRRQLGAIKPPTEARPLHTTLLRLVDLEFGVAYDLRSMTLYMPQLGRALAPLANATKGLRSALRTAHNWVAERRALRAYCSALAGVSDRLAALSAPPELRPSLESERATVRRSLGGCPRVDAALAHKRTSGLAAGLQTVFAASQPAARQAVLVERAAVRAYNGRLDRIDALSAEIQRERQRLQQRLQ